MATKKEIIKLIETIIPAFEPEPPHGQLEGGRLVWLAKMEVADDYDAIKPELARLLDKLETGQ